MLSRSRLTASEAITVLFTESEAGVASDDEPDTIEIDHDDQSDDSEVEEPLNINYNHSEVNCLLEMFGLDEA